MSANVLPMVGHSNLQHDTPFVTQSRKGPRMTLPIEQIISEHINQIQPLGANLAANAEPVHRAIAAEIIALVAKITKDGGDQENPVDWAIGRKYSTAPPPDGHGGPANPNNVTNYRIDAFNFEKYRGINAVQLNDLAAKDVVILKGPNGTGKSSLLEALCGKPCSPTLRFNGAPPRQLVHEVTYIAADPAGQPAVPLLYDKNMVNLVMPDIPKILSAGLDVDNALGAAAGVTRLENRLKVALRMCGNNAAFLWELGAGPNSLICNDNAGAPPPAVALQYGVWKTALIQYRELCGLGNNDAVRTDLAHWNTEASGLWQEVKGAALWVGIIPDDGMQATMTAHLQAIQQRINTFAAPPELNLIRQWLTNYKNDPQGRRAAFADAIIGLADASNALLASIACNDLKQVVGMQSSGDGQAQVRPHLDTDAVAIVNALESRAGLPGINLAPNPNLNEAELGRLRDAASTAIVNWIQQIHDRLAAINGAIAAIDRKRAACENALEFLQGDPNANSCPVCNTAKDRASLIGDLTCVLAQTDPRTKPLETERATLIVELERLNSVLPGLNAASDAWDHARNTRNTARCHLIALVDYMTIPRAEHEVAQRLVDGVVDAATRWIGKVNLRPDDEMQDWCSGVFLPLVTEAETDLGLIIGGYADQMAAFQNILWRLHALKDVIAADRAIANIAWNNQANQILQDRYSNELVPLWRAAAQMYADGLKVEIDNVRQQLVNNPAVQATYEQLIIAGNAQPRHPFFDGGLNNPNDWLSEGYRVLHAIAAVVAVASVPTPGNDAGFILLDEPTNGLDRDLKKAVGEFLGQYCEKQLFIGTYDDDFIAAVYQGAQLSGKEFAQYDLTWDPNNGTTVLPA